jgi:hypothetical protein
LDALIPWDHDDRAAHKPPQGIRKQERQEENESASQQRTSNRLSRPLFQGAAKNVADDGEVQGILTDQVC